MAIVYKNSSGVAGGSGGVSTLATSPALTCALHDTLVLFVLSNAGTVAGVSSSIGNTYTWIATHQANYVSPFTLTIYICIDSKAGNDIATVTTTGTTAFQRAWLMQYAGADNTNPVAAYGFSDGSPGSGSRQIPLGTVTVTDPAGMLVACGVSNGGTNGAGPGFTQRETVSSESVEDGPWTAAGTYTPTITSAGLEYVGATVALLPAAGGGGVTVAHLLGLMGCGL